MKVLQINLTQSGNTVTDYAKNTGYMSCLTDIVRYINTYCPKGEALDRDELMKAIVFAAQEVSDKHETDGIINQINQSQCQSH